MLGKNIKKFREKTGLTQEQLGARLCISPQAISKWETGENQPDCSMLPDIAEALGVSTDRLFDRGKASFEDVAYEIRAYMAGISQEEKLEAVRRLAYYGENAMLGNDPEAEYFLKREWDFSGKSYSVCNEFDSGFTFSSNRPELPFYAVFPEPQKGWKAVLKPGDYAEFFGIMADSKVLDTLFRLYERKRLAFDSEYAKREFDLAEPEKVLSKIEKLGILWRESCNINGKEICIWNFYDRCGLIAIFAVLNEFLYHNCQFELQSDRRSLPYLR